MLIGPRRVFRCRLSLPRGAKRTHQFSAASSRPCITGDTCTRRGIKRRRLFIHTFCSLTAHTTSLSAFGARGAKVVSVGGSLSRLLLRLYQFRSVLWRMKEGVTHTHTRSQTCVYIQCIFLTWDNKHASNPISAHEKNLRSLRVWLMDICCQWCIYYFCWW